MNAHDLQTFLDAAARLLFPHVWDKSDRKALLLDAFYATDYWFLNTISLDEHPKPDDFARLCCVV